jgi:hypothetical protein
MKNSRFRIAYTLGDLFVLVALAALAVALVLEFQQRAESTRRYIQSTLLTNDGNHLIVAFLDGGVSCCNLATGNIDGGLEPSNLYAKDAPMAISPDGRLAARTLWSNPPPPESVTFVLQVCDLQSGRERYQIKTDCLVSAAFSRDGTRLAFDNPRINKLFVVDVANPSQEIALAPLDRQGNRTEDTPWNYQILFGANSDVVYRLGADGDLARWNVATRMAARKQLELGSEHWLAQSSDSARLAVATTQPSGIPEGATIETLVSDELNVVAQSKPLSRAHAIAYVNHGKSLVALMAADNELQILDAESFQLQRRIPVPAQTWRLTALDAEHGAAIAIADAQSAYLLDGNGWRQMLSMAPPRHRAAWLMLAIPSVCGVWLWIRSRRKRAVGLATACADNDSPYRPRDSATS